MALSSLKGQTETWLEICEIRGMSSTPSSALTPALESGLARKEWAAHWKVPVVSAVMLMVANSHYYSLGVLIPAIEQDQGWSRSQISAGMIFASIGAVLIAPFIGAFVDRFGSRRVALPGSVLYCAALASAAFVGSSIAYWWAVWIMIGLCMLLVSPPVMTAAVVSHFDRGRGLALAVTLCGTGLASAFLPLVAELLQFSFGWRGAYIALSLGGGMLTFTLMWLFFFSASDQTRKQHKGGSAAAAGVPGRRLFPGPSLRNALFSSRYLRMLLAALMILLALGAVIVHFIPIMRESGIASRSAAIIAGIIGVTSLFGRVLVGWLLDRYDGPKVGLLFFALPSLPIAIMLMEPGMPVYALCAVLIGMALGAEFDILAYLTSRYFGLRHYGALFGAIWGVTALGVGLGPLLAGAIYDSSGSYSSLFLVLLPLPLLAALLVRSLGPYPDLEKA